MFYNDAIRANTRGGHLMKTDLGDNIRKLRKELVAEVVSKIFPFERKDVIVRKL